ncbi:hypothetical protein HPB51_023463 [Rhipicephalus microplus]|uniref:Tick transposon n=1 Tax=Rhipicephalus microplus TaxID=6941 RepID=A0A9J6F9B0_RHIMP|nr:hypothetical protein HPB51_023463 [Rhipicephalus microplus]
MPKILLYAPQVLLTVFFVWPFRPTRIDPGQAFQASTGDDVLDIYNRGCDGINLRLSNSTFTWNTAKVTAAALWRTDINKPRSTLAFSGHGSSVRETMPKILLYAPQVRNQFSLFAQRSNNRFLILLPCPQVLCETLLDCVDVALLLLLSGDIETNPGPSNPRNQSTAPDEPQDANSEQMNTMLQILKDINERTIAFTKGQADLQTDITEIKSGQQAIETKLVDIFGRLEYLESKSDVIEQMRGDLAAVSDAAERLMSQQDVLQSRLDDLEDRSRRSNLLVHGIPDSRESWQDTEEKTLAALSSATGKAITGNDVDRVHRIGTFSSSKTRPVIIKFRSFKMKEAILSDRAVLKTKDIAVSEDYSVATRQARKKLVEFGKGQPHSPRFQLRYNKLIIDDRCFMYDTVSDSVKEIKRAPPTAPLPNATSAAPLLASASALSGRPTS